MSFHSTKSWRRIGGLVLGLLLLCGLMAACSGTSSSSGSAQSGTSVPAAAGTDVSSGTAGSTSSFLSIAQANVAKASQAPSRITVTTPLKEKPAAGKSVIYISCNLQCPIVGNGIKAAADSVGWTFKQIIYDPADPSSYISSRCGSADGWGAGEPVACAVAPGPAADRAYLLLFHH